MEDAHGEDLVAPQGCGGEQLRWHYVSCRALRACRNQQRPQVCKQLL